MYRHHHWTDGTVAEKTAERQTASLAGVAIILLLLVGGLALVHHLHRAALIEDCLMAGRSNCDALLVRPH